MAIADVCARITSDVCDYFASHSTNSRTSAMALATPRVDAFPPSPRRVRVAAATGHAVGGVARFDLTVTKSRSLRWLWLHQAWNLCRPYRKYALCLL
jgi:hypothetical protein